MSKRFGRNQRRRAREALAASETEIALLKRGMELDRHLMRSIRQDLEEARAFQRDVAAIVGRQAVIAGEPVNLDLGRMTFDQADGWRVIPILPARWTVPSFTDAPPTMEAIRHEILRLLDIELVADRMRGQMQAWVRIAGAEVCYGMTESAFRAMTEPELMRQLVGPVARQLAMELKRRFR